MNFILENFFYIIRYYQPITVTISEYSFEKINNVISYNQRLTEFRYILVIMKQGCRQSKETKRDGAQSYYSKELAPKR